MRTRRLGGEGGRLDGSLVDDSDRGGNDQRREGEEGGEEGSAHLRKRCRRRE